MGDNGADKLDLALQGGGSAAVPITEGFLRGLKALGVLEKSSEMVGISGAQFAVAALGYSERPLESLLSMSRLPADPNAVPEYEGIAEGGTLSLDDVVEGSMVEAFTTGFDGVGVGCCTSSLRSIMECCPCFKTSISSAWPVAIDFMLIKLGIEPEKFTKFTASNRLAMEETIAKTTRATGRKLTENDFIVVNEGVPKPVFCLRLAAPEANNGEYLWLWAKSRWNAYKTLNQDNRDWASLFPFDWVFAIDEFKLEAVTMARDEVGGALPVPFTARADAISHGYSGTVKASVKAASSANCCSRTIHKLTCGRCGSGAHTGGWDEMRFSPHSTPVTEFGGDEGMRLMDVVAVGTDALGVRTDDSYLKGKDGPGGHFGVVQAGDTNGLPGWPTDPDYTEPDAPFFDAWTQGNSGRGGCCALISDAVSFFTTNTASHPTRRILDIKPGKGEPPVCCLMDDGGYGDFHGLATAVAGGAQKVIVAAFSNFPRAEGDPEDMYVYTKTSAPMELNSRNNALGVIPSYFGLIGLEPHFISTQNVIFADGHAQMGELYRQFDACLEKGEPLVAVLEGLETVDNPFFGVEAGRKVDVLFYLRDNALPNQWTSKVPLDHPLVAEGFPSLTTFTPLNYPPPLANMVADLVAWEVTSSKAKFDALLAN